MKAILAIDGGATRTRAGLYDEAGTLLAEAEGDPSNVSEVRWQDAIQISADLGRRLVADTRAELVGVAGGFAGVARTGRGPDVANGLQDALSVNNVRVSSDAHALFLANCDEAHPLLVIAGTGSCVIARSAKGEPVVAGGLGPILSDEGSGYHIALDGIRNAEADAELRGALLRSADVSTYERFLVWLELSAKDTVAALAPEVLRCAEAGNSSARKAVSNQAGLLADLVVTALRRAQLDIETAEPLFVFVAGGLLSHSAYYRNAFSDALRREIPRSEIADPPYTGHAAAFRLMYADAPRDLVAQPGETRPASNPGTEERGDLWESLDSQTSKEIARTMALSEILSAHTVSKSGTTVSNAIDSAAERLRAGGRIIYAGAGTSGRLGVLDAAECPPTFGVSEDRVIALIAGGDEALRHSVEGAEDDTEAAVRDLDAIDDPPVGPNDLVIGISASGTTPYALAAIDRAKALGAHTALVCCNPVPLDRADIVIALDTGPEVLPGSTRLKAGTATKIVLNQISTGAMAKAGYVFEGRMVGVRPLNKKLRQRCIRIIAELTGEPEDRAEQRLDETGGSIPLAVLMARKNLALDEARRRLDAAHGILRDALEEV